VDEASRFTAIQVLLGAVRWEGPQFVYAAVDRKKFELSPFGTGRPLVTAFRMCLLEVEDWATANHPDRSGGKAKTLDWNDTYLCILDDCDNKALKDELRRAYRTLRSKHPFIPPHENRLWHAHDDMFFVDSKDSLGVQIVDLCNFFVKRRIVGEADPNNFYDEFAVRITCAKPEPESTLYRELFRTHSGPASAFREGEPRVGGSDDVVQANDRRPTTAP
jgi:Protein of unknown function (DUF3800)